MQRVGILHQSHIPQAVVTAEALAARAKELGRAVWLRSSWDDGLAQLDVSDTGLIICVGGDGTLLRVTRVAAPSGVPILGVNAGRLGFLTEVDASDALDVLPHALAGEGWTEERVMLAVEYGEMTAYALNDAIISRGSPARTVQTNVSVNGTELLAVRGDGIIVASATGSTAYNLAAGGPVLPPATQELVLNPVSAHPAAESAVLLEPAVVVSIRVKTDHGAFLSLDGQEDYPVSDGAEIIIRESPHRARFLRFRPPGYFYASLSDLLHRRRRHPDLPDPDAASGAAARQGE